MNTSNKSLLPKLVTAKTGLGYCCVYGFFSIFKRTEMIALRLGITSRSVRTYKARFNAGLYVCEDKENCMKCAIKVIKKTGMPEGIKNVDSTK